MNTPPPDGVALPMPNDLSDAPPVEPPREAPIGGPASALPSGYQIIDYAISMYVAGERQHPCTEGVVVLRGRAATPIVPTRRPWRKRTDAQRREVTAEFWAQHGELFALDLDGLLSDVVAYEATCVKAKIQPFPPDVRKRLKSPRWAVAEQRKYITALAKARRSAVRAKKARATLLAKLPEAIRIDVTALAEGTEIPDGFSTQPCQTHWWVTFRRDVMIEGATVHVGGRLADPLDTIAAHARRGEVARANRLAAFWSTHGAAARPAVEALTTDVVALITASRTQRMTDLVDAKVCSAFSQPSRSITEQRALVTMLTGELGRRVRRREMADAVRARVTLSDYAATFPAATTARRFTALLGPTNSGKTHRAFARLGTAATGMYLAPLRLLALEGYARLNAEFGAPCDLVTGEEHRETLGARFVSSTVEMCDPHRRVEVAVVDEVQMLGDRERGWAWTQALAGANADEVWLLGSPSAEPALRALAGRLGVPLTVERTERLGPLQMEDRPLSPDPWKALDAVREGDAMIVFSRRDALRLRDDLRAKGLTVACIYGALSPEVREREAARFASGEATVLVATDAIGMGLNLPIARVVFTAVEKYDGEKRVDLPRAMVQQIAGRAGRHGLAGAGLVAGLTPGEHGYVANQLRAHVTSLATSGFGVAPTLDHLEAIQDASGETSLALLLELFTRHVATDGFFSPAVTDDQQLRAAWFDEGGPRGLSLADRHTLSLVPVSTRDDYAVGLWQAWCRDVARGTPATLSFARAAADAIHVPLGRAEALVQALGGYTWLARRRPELFPEEDAAHALATHWSTVVEEHLRSPRPQGDGAGSYRGMPSWYWAPRGYRPPRLDWDDEDDCEEDDLYD